MPDLGAAVATSIDSAYASIFLYEIVCCGGGGGGGGGVTNSSRAHHHADSSVSIMSAKSGGNFIFFGFYRQRWPPFPCLSGKSSELNRGETTLAVIKFCARSSSRVGKGEYYISLTVKYKEAGGRNKFGEVVTGTVFKKMLLLIKLHF